MTDDLIHHLARDLTVRWPLRRTVGAAVAGGALVAGLLFFATLGLRPDIAQALHTVRFPFKFVVTLALAAAALALLDRMARPGAPLGLARLALAGVPMLLALAVVAELVAMPEATWGTRLRGANAIYCLVCIPMLALGPLGLLLAALRFGAPDHPGRAGAVAGLAASGIAATFYAAHCPDDSPLFVATWYGIATLAVVLIGAAAGRRWLVW